MSGHRIRDIKNPWTNVYGAGRTVLALSTLATLIWNDGVTLFSPAAYGVVDTDALEVRLSFFGLLRGNLELARILAIGGMLVVASGWRPRFTGVLHWWLAWSFHVNVIPSDGGDQIAAIVALLLIPLTLGDPRRWHWQAAPPLHAKWMVFCSRLGLASILFVRLQAAVVYLHAGVGKLYVAEWLNGTALYYWLLDPRVGVPAPYHEWVLWLMAPDFMAPLLSWGPVLLELALFLSLAMSPDHVWRRPLFWLGLAFHAANVLFFGLVSFFFSMSGLLILFMRPVDQPFAFKLPSFESSRFRSIWTGYRTAQLMPGSDGKGW